jgi:hypothetical protein
MNPATERANPFAGPRPLTETQRDRFFERAPLVREAVLLVLAQRLVIVHGASGVGKTSLLRAGVLPGLEERGATVLPVVEIDGMAARNRSGAEPAGAYWQHYLDRAFPAVDEAVADAGDEAATASEVVAQALARARRRSLRSAARATRVLVIDQAQDLFFDRTPVGEAERTTFTAALERAMADDRRLHLVLVVDDAYLSAARALAARMQLTTQPVLVNVPPFTQEQAREVVARTAALDDVVIDVDGVVREAAAATRTTEAEQTDETRLVDPILLQTVAWRTVQEATNDEGEPEAPERSRLLAPIDILRGRRRGGDELAGPLRELFSDAVARADEAGEWDEQRIRRWAVDALVSPLGTRAPVAPPAVDSAEAAVIEAFEEGAFVERVEHDSSSAVRLAHDRLVPELVASNRGFFSMRPLLVLLRAAAVAAVLLLAGALVFAVIGATQYQRAENALDRVAELEAELSATPTATLTPTATPTPTDTPTPPVITISDVTCQPAEVYAGDSVLCSADYSGEAQSHDYRWHEGGIERGTGLVLPLDEGAPQPVGSRVLVFEVCPVGEADCVSKQVRVEVNPRLGFAPLSLEVVTDAELDLTNEARRRPTVWSLTAPEWLDVAPSSGTLGENESIVVTLSVTSTAPAAGAEGEITFEAGPSSASMVDAGAVSVIAAPQLPPQLFLPGDLLFTEPEPGAGHLVEYTASATDSIDGNLAVTCLPPSGSVFPVGSTLVECRAVNSLGQSATGSFGVVVLEAEVPDPGGSATCALFIDGALKKTTCTAVVEFWESQGKPELADPYRAAAAAEAEAAAGP